VKGLDKLIPFGMQHDQFSVKIWQPKEGRKEL